MNCPYVLERVVWTCRIHALPGLIGMVAKMGAWISAGRQASKQASRLNTQRAEFAANVEWRFTRSDPGLGARRNRSPRASFRRR
jgi:hypothetical protein